MLSLVLPTYKEAKNLPHLLPEIERTMGGRPYEVIVVDDDSPDRTWEVARQLSESRPHLRVIRRVGRRGLSSAVIEGFLAAKGGRLAVADADGQHDLRLLPRLADALDDADVAVGSRYVEGGSIGEWDERRYLLSRLGTWFAVGLCVAKVKDPMSGFFAIRRETFEAALPTLNPKGFKILLDLLVHAPAGTRAVELPFAFRPRLHGESKLSPLVQLQFLEYLYDVTLGRWIPLLFWKYCAVGAMGVVVHLLAYVAARRLMGDELAGLGFSRPLLLAIEVAIVFNFLLNNVWTFAHARLRGMAAVAGFVSYNAACLLGALANVAVSTYLFLRGWHEIPSVAVGAFIGMVWNYTMSRLLTWRT